MNSLDEARGDLEHYNIWLVFHVTDGEPFAVRIEGGEAREVRGGQVDMSPNDLKLESDKSTLQEMFQRRLTPASAWLEDRLFIHGMKAKQNIVARITRAITVTQEKLN